MSAKTINLRVKPEKAGRGEAKLTGTIIHGGYEHGPGCKVPEGADMDRLKRLGLVGSKAQGEPEHDAEASQVPAERPHRRSS